MSEQAPIVGEYLYIYIDEGGNFDFSSSGTRYFSLSCVIMIRPFGINSMLDAYKYDCIEYGLPQEYFHCADDNKYVRARIFSIISKNAPHIILESLIVNKQHVGPRLQEAKRFYPFALGSLLKNALEKYASKPLLKIIVITDTIPINKKRRAIEKAIKHTLKAMLPDGIEYTLWHHASRAHYGLQIADYCNWAVLRKYEKGDNDFYEKIQVSIKNEYHMNVIELNPEIDTKNDPLNYSLAGENPLGSCH